MANPVQAPPLHARSTPASPSRVQKARIMSNMVSVVNRAQNSPPTRMSGAARAQSASPGHSRRARPAVRNRLARPNSGATRRGHHSLTPNTAHPRLISQNRSGGLWL